MRKNKNNKVCLKVFVAMKVAFNENVLFIMKYKKMW